MLSYVVCNISGDGRQVQGRLLHSAGSDVRVKETVRRHRLELCRTSLLLQYCLYCMTGTHTAYAVLQCENVILCDCCDIDEVWWKKLKIVIALSAIVAETVE